VLVSMRTVSIAPRAPCATLRIRAGEPPAPGPRGSATSCKESAMRASRMHIATLRDDPSDAEVASHRLLLRSGCMVKSGSGLYLYAPLMQRVLDKIKRIVADEISRAGGLEVTMPIMQEQALWEKSGRWATYQASKTMLSVKDRAGQVFGLAPTAEEVVTDYAAKVVTSYKQLPVCFFQQHTKFRDEIRPRFGLIRVKEFIMMDAYSFHASEECLGRTYEAMRAAYTRAFLRCGVEAFAVEADTGAIGGTGSHEFMLAADIGEDAIIYNPASGYAANVERAVGRLPAAPAWASAPATATKVHTPGVGAIDDVMAYLTGHGYAGVSAAHGLKCVLMMAQVDAGNGKQADVPAAAFVRGDREVNEVKLSNAIGRIGGRPVLALRPMHADEVRAATGAEPGFAGPGAGLTVALRLIDEHLRDAGPLIAGANATDHHLVGFDISRDALPGFHWVDLLRVRAGDGDATTATGTLQEKRGIEVGHVFKLGTKYSQAMGAEYLGPDQKRHPFIMGCYGIGTSRVVAAAVEQHHDADGIRWPVSIAPYQVVVVPAGKPGDTAVEQTAESIYADLIAAGIEAVIDDRDAKPGVKFKDWDLIGIPYRIVCGRGVAEGVVEAKPRGGESTNLPIAEAAHTAALWVRGQMALREAAAG
jgi:prolyl-tRNA synthetase